MTEYWKSTPRHFCKVCGCWMDAKPNSIRHHEQGLRHKGNVEREYQRKKREKIMAEKAQQTKMKDLAAMEAAARKAILQDEQNGLVNANGLTSLQYHHSPNKNSKYKEQDATDNSFVSERLNYLPDESYYYLDDNNKEQGPFDIEQMALWYHLRYFNKSLEIRNSNEPKFIKVEKIKDPFCYFRFKNKISNDLEYRTKLLQHFENVPPNLKNEKIEMTMKYNEKRKEMNTNSNKNKNKKSESENDDDDDEEEEEEEDDDLPPGMTSVKMDNNENNNNDNNNNNKEKETDKEKSKKIEAKVDEFGFGVWESSDITENEMYGDESNDVNSNKKKGNNENENENGKKRWWRNVINENLPLAKKRRQLGLDKLEENDEYLNTNSNNEHFINDNDGFLRDYGISSIQSTETQDSFGISDNNNDNNDNNNNNNNKNQFNNKSNNNTNNNTKNKSKQNMFSISISDKTRKELSRKRASEWIDDDIDTIDESTLNNYEKAKLMLLRENRQEALSYQDETIEDSVLNSTLNNLEKKGMIATTFYNQQNDNNTRDNDDNHVIDTSEMFNKKKKKKKKKSKK